MDAGEILRMVDAIGRDKSIDKDIIFEGIEEALQASVALLRRWLLLSFRLRRVSASGARGLFRVIV